VYSCGPQRHVRVRGHWLRHTPRRIQSHSAQAIVEVISFNGDGTVDTPKVTLNVNGTVINESPGSSGTYTIDTATANGVCTGTLNFRGTATRRAH
jgi:hypothetical protein